MNKEDLNARVDKIFRANIIEVEEIVGQYDQKKLVKKVGDIEELKQDIKDLISGEFKVGKIDKAEIFIGTGKIGASYQASVALKVAKEWGFKYMAWNGGEIYDISGKSLGINYNEL